MMYLQWIKVVRPIFHNDPMLMQGETREEKRNHICIHICHYNGIFHGDSNRGSCFWPDNHATDGRKEFSLPHCPPCTNNTYDQDHSDNELIKNR